MSKLYSGAEIVFKCLEDQNVEFVFGYPGGAVLPIYDELKNFNFLKHILVRHEQGAGHAAEGYARSTGKPGVLIVTSGPGATNAVTALTDAYMDSVPLVCISGQVPTHLIGTDAFQECDTTGITRPCTKHNWLVKDIKDLGKTIHKAFEVATTGRPGPVLVDIPKDIQFAKTKYVSIKKEKNIEVKSKNKFNQKDIDQLIELMNKASKPIFYTGGGVVNSGPKASELLRELVALTGFPITSTLQGLGSYPGDDNQFLGMLGMHGTYEANNAMHDCDVMINIGARFDDRVTGRLDAFSPNSKKIHIDIDESNINKTINVDIPVVGDVTSVLTEVIKKWKQTKSEINQKDIKLWWDKTGDLGGSAYVQLDPNDAEKIVFVRNSLASSRSILLFQGTYNSGRDLEIPAGVDMVVKFDGGGASAATVTDVYTKLRATEITTPTLTAGTAAIHSGDLF